MTDCLIGTDLLGYRVDAVLGRGGMGVVYRAWDARLKRHVAVKLVAPERSEDSEFRERFRVESELAASLEHPNVVPVYDAGEVQRRLVIVMRYVRGTDLKRLLEAERPLAPARAVAICGQVAAALDAAHEQRLVHRDVKPSNVLLDEHGHAYLADFGLTGWLADRGSGVGRSFGTPGYAAPEQIRGDSVDGRTDVYSLACVLFECLTGEPPYRGTGELALLWAHLEEPPPRASERRQSLPEPVDRVLARALAKRPEGRQPDCGALVDEAREALGLRELRGRPRSRPLLAAAAALLAVVVALAAVLLARESGGVPAASTEVADNTLVRIDPETNEVVAAVEVGSGLKSVAVGGSTVWVYNVTEGTVSAVDADTHEVVRVSRVSTNPVESAYFNGPLIAADREGAWVVGTREGGGLLTRIRRGSDRPVEYPLVGARPLGDPVGIAVGRGSVWVLTRGADIFGYRGPGDEVLRLSPETGSVLARHDAPGQQASGAGTVYGLAVGAEAVWVTNAETGRLFAFHPSSLALRRGRDVGRGAAGVPSVGYGYVWASAASGSSLVRIDPRTFRASRLALGGRVVDVTFAAGSVWANDATAGAVYRIDPRTASIVAEITLTAGSSRAPALGSLASPTIAAGAGGVWVTVGAPAVR